MTSQIASRLLTCDCPAIQYQCALLTHNLGQADGFRRGLEASQDVQRILDNGRESARSPTFQTIHGAANYHLENVLPMLMDRGLDCSFTDFDQFCRPLLSVIDQAPTGNVLDRLPLIILASSLLEAGYREPNLLDFYHKRLDLVSAFCQHMRFDIYAAPGQYRSIPKPFRDRQVIRPELYKNGDFQFPLLYDLYAYRAMYGQSSPREQAKIDCVLTYILSEPYQQFPRGYGILLQRRGYFYAMGWDAKLPFSETGELTAEVLHRLELFASLPLAAQSPWFQSHLALLQSHRREDGMYGLPKDSLREREMCWVLGGHKSLGENRRKKGVLLVNGTFRAYRLLSKLA